MIKLETKVQIKNHHAKDFFKFFINCDDAEYQQWWPGEHFSFHTILKKTDNVGNIVYFDEKIAGRRLKFKATIIKVSPDRFITYQMIDFFRLPAWLTVMFEDADNGTIVTHTLLVGYEGIGRIFDPLFGLYLTKKFEKDLSDHALKEFQLLAELLKKESSSE